MFRVQYAATHQPTPKHSMANIKGPSRQLPRSGRSVCVGGGRWTGEGRGKRWYTVIHTTVFVSKDKCATTAQGRVELPLTRSVIYTHGLVQLVCMRTGCNMGGRVLVPHLTERACTHAKKFPRYRNMTTQGTHHPRQAHEIIAKLLYVWYVACAYGHFFLC